MPIGRNSFIQMTKLSNVKGRITYISSHAKQENLYAVYETTERKFWRELAKCNQEEFAKSGTEGKCIEARELIIALPESFTEYQPDRLLQLFTNHFKQNYGAECIAALHHNKRKTNYHIHLIFAERKLLDEQTERSAENIVPESVKIKEEKTESKQPEMTRLASKYPKFFKVKKELDEQNTAIQQKQKQLSAKKKELSEVKGWFKGRKKKELQGEIDALTSQIRDMKDYLPRIVQKIGYRSVQEFLKDFKVSKTEYSQYRIAIEKWKKETGKEPVAHGIRAKLAEKKQEIQNEQKNKQRTHKQNKDRGAR